MADYRNGAGFVLDDGAYGDDAHDRGLAARRSMDRPPGAARSRRLPRGAPPPSAASIGLDGGCAERRLGPASCRAAALSRAGPILAIGHPRRRVDPTHRSRHRPLTHTRSRGRPSDEPPPAIPTTSSSTPTGPAAPQRPEGPLRRGRRRHHRLRAEPHPGRRRLELDEPAVRRHPPRHRQPRGVLELLQRVRASAPDTTIVLYGDNNNWFAAWAYWQLKLYGHQDVSIINGGRKYWLDNGLPLSVDVPSLPGDRLPAAGGRPRRCAPSATTSCRASATQGFALVDVRSPGRVQRRDHRASRA